MIETAAVASPTSLLASVTVSSLVVSVLRVTRGGRRSSVFADRSVDDRHGQSSDFIIAHVHRIRAVGMPAALAVTVTVWVPSTIASSTPLIVKGADVA